MKITTTKKLVPKVLVLFLAFIFCWESTAWSHPAVGAIKGTKDNFTVALKAYKKGFYQETAALLESFLEILQEEEPGLRAKVYLLLGACYEKLGKEDKARDYFKDLKEMLDNKLIGHVPGIKEIDAEEFSTYREVFSGSSFFSFREPVPVDEMMKKNVILAPRKTLEQKEREKEKKKFPWLLAVGGVVIVGVAAVLLISSRSNKNPQFQDVQWIRIPAGEFMMGDNFDEGEADEQPVHKVYLDEYYISKYEITIQQYGFFCDEAGRESPVVYEPRSSSPNPPTNEPMHYISWMDAQAFCDWLSQRIGKKVQLPTEAQWEKAARGTHQYRYPWGNFAPDCTIVMYRDCLGYADSSRGFVSVYSFSSGSSPHGLHHMAGNVREWCLDWYDPAYYSISPEKNPRGPANGSLRVIRGGGKWSNISRIRSANRDFDKPDGYGGDLGFRVVMEEE